VIPHTIHVISAKITLEQMFLSPAQQPIVMVQMFCTNKHGVGRLATHVKMTDPSNVGWEKITLKSVGAVKTRSPRALKPAST